MEQRQAGQSKEGKPTRPLAPPLDRGSVPAGPAPSGLVLSLSLQGPEEEATPGVPTSPWRQVYQSICHQVKQSQDTSWWGVGVPRRLV
jgi:hypothetical protein